MFEARVYQTRRQALKQKLGSGVALFPGNKEAPINYPANTYYFRQDSSFLYFFGLDSPNLYGLIDIDEDKEIIFGDDLSLEDIIWMGHQPRLQDKAKKVGIKEVRPLKDLEPTIKNFIAQGRKVHYLPPYRPETVLELAQLLEKPAEEIKAGASKDLIKATVALRSVKEEIEIKEIEAALNITREMYLIAMKMARPGKTEWELVGAMEGIALSHGCRLAFPTILTINGQILHNHDHSNRLIKGKLLVIDAGVESTEHYAADITRTIPVGWKFSQKQREIYEIVLKAQETALKAIKPGIPYKEVHLQTCQVMASGLKELGLMKGDIVEAVEQGAHALFFPHGLGHMLGLDVHDMEGLGEDYVGYNDTVKRSQQFGLGYLRLAKTLEAGFVLTVEPGIYFIPPLIAKWKKEKKHSQFINYSKVMEYIDFGGIRIEDDVLVTKDGPRVLGKKIPKKVEEIESLKA
ncbi:MAG: aminopeptidase P family protein [Candidatus Aminicenantes bacterium]|nr:aminopeptidase P family protein [Candidatus Aminicenantes bacterium]